jgi:hypothetical protein
MRYAPSQHVQSSAEKFVLVVDDDILVRESLSELPQVFEVARFGPHAEGHSGSRNSDNISPEHHLRKSTLMCVSPSKLIASWNHRLGNAGN